MKPRIFSGIQPSGNLHIGNYLGAIKQWVEMQEQYESIFCIVDLHAITVPQDPESLRKRTLEVAKIYLAAGINSENSTLFIQSHVREHTELCWILNTITKNGDLTKMTQFKDKTGFDEERFKGFLERIGEEDFIEKMIGKAIYKSLEEEKIFKKEELKESVSKEKAIELFFRPGMERGFERGVNNVKKFFQEEFLEKFNFSKVGLFDYPVLMAADIVLYDTAVVPVGDDQVQHVELARTLARRFNRQFGETFVIPEAKVHKEGARIMGLDNPMKKMSKSATSEYNYVALLDSPDMARKKIMKAVTDSGTDIVYADDKPALKNLINMYSLLGNIPTKDVVEKFHGKGYADFKRDLADVVADFLVNFQRKFQALSDEEALRILKEGAERARAIASEKMAVVRERVGFVHDAL